MKPEKPKKAKAPAKRTSSARRESSPPAPAKRAAAKGVAAETPDRKPSAKPSAVKRASQSKPAPVRAVPPILLEGDAPATPPPSGPGRRYAIGTTNPSSLESETAELPEAYGTQRLLLVARDPHWLYAHWDMTLEQLRQHNTASRDGHLIVRVFRDQPAGKPVLEQHVHPESRNWFLHVGRGGVKYIAQLGYLDRSGAWNSIATSSATLTPPDVLSDDTTVRFETIPVEVPFEKLLALVKDAVAEHTPLVEVIQELRKAGYPELPHLVPERGAAAPAWTPAQERALARIVSIDEVRRVWMGSLEITELIRRSLAQEISSQAAAALARGEQFGAAAQPSGVFSVSSPFGGEAHRKGFWFNVNAELIIYGATEPDAAVTIGGRKIQLRPDGTFSFRFALPDGNYDLPVQATASDGSDSRRAALKFSRATQYRGEVGKHAQDKALKTPRAENVA
ncbi:MAG TPA: DUF4912 domain-containing protein [Methylomirabilota bacterium]|nr:DUF4912 domain-containing protein [Methylomirabilota bacterium]